MVTAGQRSCFITVKKHNAVSRDPYADPTQLTDVVVKTLWGALYPQRGAETFVNFQRGSTVSHKVVLDFYDAEGISEDMFLDVDGRRFDITAILRDEVTRQSVTLMAVEKPYGA